MQLPLHLQCGKTHIRAVQISNYVQEEKEWNQPPCEFGNYCAFDVTVEGESFVLRPRRKPKYTLQELLDQCDFSIPMDQEERDWLDAPRVGRELI